MANNTPADLENKRKQDEIDYKKGYDDSSKAHTPEKNDGRVSAFAKKWGRKLLADPIMDAITRNDARYNAGSYQARKDILGYGCGGKVKKAAGGSVCRGGGCATRGTKFGGVK